MDEGACGVLPVQPGWADQLAGITLSGPGGSVTLDEETDRPMWLFCAIRGPGRCEASCEAPGPEPG